MQYTFEQTHESWTVWRVVALSDKRTERTKVATYIYESDAQYISDILNDHSNGEA